MRSQSSQQVFFSLKFNRLHFGIMQCTIILCPAHALNSSVCVPPCRTASQRCTGETRERGPWTSTSTATRSRPGQARARPPDPRPLSSAPKGRSSSCAEFSPTRNGSVFWRSVSRVCVVFVCFARLNEVPAADLLHWVCRFFVGGVVASAMHTHDPVEVEGSVDRGIPHRKHCTAFRGVFSEVLRVLGGTLTRFLGARKVRTRCRL